MALHVSLPDEAATQACARAFANLLRAGDVVALSGPLGAGKSVFARAVIRARCGDEGLEVPSPTFTLVQIYDQTDPPLWHFDFYRLEDPEEVPETGFEEALDGGISLIEWPSRMGPWLPATALSLTLEPTGTGNARTLTIADHPPPWQSRQQALEGLA